MKIILLPYGGIGNQLLQLSYAHKYRAAYKENKIFCLRKGIKPRGGDERSLALGKLSFNLEFLNIPFLPNTRRLRAIVAPLYGFSVATGRGTQSEGKRGLLVDVSHFHPREVYPEIQDIGLKLLKQSATRFGPSMLPGNVCVHVRRGDYISNKKAARKHGFMGIDYFVKSIGLFREIYKDAKFHVFSDDYEWAQDKFGFLGENVIIYSSLTDIDTFLKMFSFKNFIISNSTFSWWPASVVSHNFQDAKVIAPRSWYADGTKSGFQLDDSWTYV